MAEHSERGDDQDPAPTQDADAQRATEEESEQVPSSEDGQAEDDESEG